MTAQDDRYLPGQPKKKLVTEVRRVLKGYGIRPHGLLMWRDAWAWALAVRDSYFHPRWPLPHEIAAQYLVLLLADMKTHPGFKLPYRAAEKQTPAIAARLAAAHARTLPGFYEPAESKQLPPATQTEEPSHAG
jgi:hypothetical protein